MRNLTISNSENLKGYREFNHLRITNLQEFFDSYKNNLDYYASPFQILSDLEDKVKFENNPEPHILVPYKEYGDVIFQLDNIVEEGGVRIVNYIFSSFIS